MYTQEDNLKIKLPSNFSNQDPTLQKKEVNSWWDLIKFAITAFVIIVPIRFFIIQPFVVSGDSMVPTFHDKDYLIVDEISYRFKSPQRGDVIIFKPPNQPKGIYYIKRIIGLPGESISIKGTKVTIVNKEHPEGYQLSEPYVQNISSDNFETTVAEGELFVLGDNRPRSSDSRVWGLLPIKNITGRALVRLFPFRDISYLPGAHEVYSPMKYPIAQK